MSAKQRRIVTTWGLRSIALLSVAGVAVYGGLVGAKSSPHVDRTIELTAQDYAFNDSNPDLKLVAGETVRIIVRNREERRSIIHNFKIPGLNIACDTPIRPGESREYIIKVPNQGEFMYTCCAHPGMGGRIKIAGRR